MSHIVSLIGGESSGKSTLTHDLCRHLEEHHGLRCLLVDEYLRTWCARTGRAPHRHEQAELARAQAQRIAEASITPGIDLVLADTTALVIAAYSEQYFGDTSLWQDALQWQRDIDLTLLMGLDLPWVADGLFRDSPAVRTETDRLLRQALARAQLPFHTIYGSGPLRLKQALRPIGHLLQRPLAEPVPAWGRGQLTWQCERCSDADCEHRLFSRLLGKAG